MMLRMINEGNRLAPLGQVDDLGNRQLLIQRHRDPDAIDDRSISHRPFIAIVTDNHQVLILKAHGQKACAHFIDRLAEFTVGPDNIWTAGFLMVAIGRCVTIVFDAVADQVTQSFETRDLIVCFADHSLHVRFLPLD